MYSSVWLVSDQYDEYEVQNASSVARSLRSFEESELPEPSGRRDRRSQWAVAAVELTQQ